jgi:ribosomal protein L16/L10AE
MLAFNCLRNGHADKAADLLALLDCVAVSAPQTLLALAMAQLRSGAVDDARHTTERYLAHTAVASHASPLDHKGPVSSVGLGHLLLSELHIAAGQSEEARRCMQRYLQQIVGIAPDHGVALGLAV